MSTKGNENKNLPAYTITIAKNAAKISLVNDNIDVSGLLHKIDIPTITEADTTAIE